MKTSTTSAPVSTQGLPSATSVPATSSATSKAAARLSQLSSLISKKHQARHQQDLRASSEKAATPINRSGAAISQPDSPAPVLSTTVAKQKKSVSWAPQTSLVTVHPVKRWVCSSKEREEKKKKKKKKKKKHTHTHTHTHTIALWV